MKKVLSVFIILCFLVTGQSGGFPVYAQDFVLPSPGLMVALSPAFNPPILKGIKVYPENPFRFDFIMDRGDLYQGRLNQDASKLIKYFLASLTIPEKDLWVNLSPYEKNRIIPQSFGMTEMGRDLLAEDYMLKQITASLIYPEGETGKRFWKRIYEEAARKFGTTDIPVNTFNKVWIVPQKAVVYENSNAATAYVVEAKLKVMLEEDYLSMIKHENGPQVSGTNRLGSNIVREIVIPELTREVNEGRNFSQLRQVYNSLILATWYKMKVKDSILNQVYADKNKLAGIRGRNDVEAIYQRYLQAFKKGVYNYIKEEQDALTQTVTPRKYFSGGEELIDVDQAMQVTRSAPKDLEDNQGNLAVVSTEINAETQETHYSDTLGSLNPQYHPSYKDPSRLRQLIDGKDFSKWTKPERVKGLEELLSAYNSETLGQDSINVILLGAGIRKTPENGYFSTQTQEVFKALKTNRSGRLFMTVVDRSPNVLAAVSGIPDLKGFLGSFEDLNYGDNDVDLIIATNSLYYSYYALHQNKEAYLALILKLIKALKPSGKFLMDQPTLAAAMPGMSINKVDSEKLMAAMPDFANELQVRGLKISWRFYKDVVEIRKLPQTDAAMLADQMWGEPLKSEDGIARDQLIGLIDADVERAYDYASQRFTGYVSGGIWAAGACRIVSNFLLNTFRGRSGFKIRLVRYKTENKALARDADFHDFIIIFFSGRAWILDLTWQQFLKEGKDSKNLPKILLVDVAHLDQKLDEMKVLKENRHYWYSALARDPVVMGMIHQDSVYRGFIPLPPRYYMTARSKLTPAALFRFVEKCMGIGRDLPPLDEFDNRVRMYQLNDKGFEVLLTILEQGIKKAPVQTRNHFLLAHDYYLQVQRERREATPVMDVYDFVYKLFKEKLLESHHGLLEGQHSSVTIDKKNISVDSIGRDPDKPVFLRVGGIIFYNEAYKGFFQGVDEKFFGLQSYPLLNNHFPISGASLDSIITSIAGLWVIKSSIQSRTVIDFNASNGIAGIVAKKLGAQNVIFVGGKENQETIDASAGEHIYPPDIYSSIDQIPLNKRENAIVLMNEGGDTDIAKYILPIKPAIIITAGSIVEFAAPVQGTLAKAGYFSHTISGLSRSDRKPFVAFIANDQAMVTGMNMNKLIAKATDDIDLAGLNKTAIPYFLKLTESSGRRHQWLYTKLISDNDLPPGYPVALREPDFYKALPGYINVHLPENDIILVSYAENGSSGVLRLASLDDGTPVAIKARYTGPIEEDNRLILKDYQEAFVLDMLGIGPRLHGLFKDKDGRISIVMDIVPGDVLKAAKEFITPGTFSDLVEINKRFRMDNKSMSFDMNYFVTPAGRILLIDPERILGTKLDPDDNAYIRYLFELLESADPVVQKQIKQELKQDGELFHKITEFIDREEKGKNTGGIDLTPANMDFQALNTGEGIDFHLDPAMLEKLRHAPGFVPVIINIQPVKDLKLFLGVSEEKSAALP